MLRSKKQEGCQAGACFDLQEYNCVWSQSDEMTNNPPHPQEFSRGQASESELAQKTDAYIDISALSGCWNTSTVDRTAKVRLFVKSVVI